MMPEIFVGARGWLHPYWDQAYYPGDLPADWRLDYYFNDFRALWVRPQDLAGAGAEEWERLSSSDPAWSPLLIECRDSLAESDPCAGPALRRLLGAGARPLALVAPDAGGGWQWTGIGAEAGPARMVASAAAVQPGETVIALIEGNAGLRQRRDELRRLIEAAGQRLILILDGQPPSITHLQALQQLAELLAP